MIRCVGKLVRVARIVAVGTSAAVLGSLILWLLGYAIVVDYALLLLGVASLVVMVGFGLLIWLDEWCWWWGVIWVVSIAAFFGTAALYDLLFGLP